MARAEANQPLIPSVLDRLLDDDPGTATELERSRNQVIRELKQSVRRDLENLLNTRWRCAGWPEDLDQLELSLVNYGIPDITGADLAGSRDRERFCRILERVISHFELRFKRVVVEMLDNTDPTDRTLRFRIDALLHAEPAPEPVVFDSALEPSTGGGGGEKGPMSDELLPYYNRELTFIRRLGAEFAESHPKIAGRLRLGPDAVGRPPRRTIDRGVRLPQRPNPA